MALYDSTPNHNVQTLVPGFASYLFGSWPVDIAPTRFVITQVSLASNVATITGTVVEGNIPAVGALITVRGSATGAGEFNVTNVAISAVSINATTGQGTISYPLAAANVAATADGGTATAPQPEIFDAFSFSGNGGRWASIPVAPPVNTPSMIPGRTMTLIINTPANTLTGTVVANLQMALMDQDSEYQNVGTSISIPTTAQVIAQEYTLQLGKFYRVQISGVTGGAATVCAKLL